MVFGRIAIIASFLAATGVPVARVSADTIRMRNKPPFRNVEVTDFRSGLLSFRGVSRELIRIPVAQVERVEIPSLKVLSEAENAVAEGNWPAAIAGYRRTIEDPGPAWVRPFANARLVDTFDRSGAFDDAVRQYCEIFRTLGPASLPAPPHRPGPVGSIVNRAAVRTLEMETGTHRTAANRRLRSLLLELALFEGLAPLPAVVLIPPDEMPYADQNPETAWISTDSFLIDEALQLAGKATPNDLAAAAVLVERAFPYIAPADRPRARIVRARVQMAAERYAEAERELASVIEQAAESEIRGEALYYLGQSQSGQGQKDAARVSFQKALEEPQTPEPLREACRNALERLSKP